MLLHISFIPEDVKPDTVKATLRIEDFGSWSQTHLSWVKKSYLACIFQFVHL